MSSDLTRRRLVGAASAAAAGLAATTADADAASRKRKPAATKAAKQTDVVVVGAGLAGLTTALRLVQGGKRVVLFEAADQVGGRTRNHKMSDGVNVELGGQFVGPTQDRMLAMGQEMGVETYLAYQDGPTAYVADGQKILYQADGPLGDIPPDPQFVADAAQLVTRLESMSASVPPDAPWTAPDAGLLDSQTVGTWIRANAVNVDRALKGFNLFFNSFYGSRVDDVSLLFFLGQIAGMGNESTPGSLQRALASKGGAQESRYLGGSQLVSQAIAGKLGRRLILSSPVRRIEQTAGRVVVTSDTRAFSARRVVVATPPQHAAAIDWHPLLPANHDAVRRRMPLGTLGKIHAVYETPFWRASGVWRGVKLDGAVREMFDNSPKGSSRGVLLGFFGGHSYRTYAPKPLAERKAAVLRDFADAFGEQALQPIDYFEQDWTAERWIRGGPVSVLGTGTTIDFLETLKKPFGQVHWAGTETSAYWNGYMDGAVRSGERAAAEVLKAL